MNVIQKTSRNACLVSAVMLLVGQASICNAQQKILIDFGSSTSYRGISVPNPDPNGHFWNSNQPGLLMDLVNVNNVATGMQLGWITPVGTDSYNGPAGDTSFGPPSENVPFTDVDLVALGDLGVIHAAFDFATGPNEGSDMVPGPANATRFDLINLDPTKAYKLTFYGAHSYNTDAFTTYSVYSDSGYTNLLGQTDLIIHNPQPEDESTDPGWRTAYNRDKVATIEGLSPGPDGNLYVNFIGKTGYFGYLNSMMIESSTPAGVVGDYNGDHKVDAADYTVWRDHLGQTFNLPNRDPANTGAISSADYTSWKNHYTGGSGSLAAGAVPEPGTIVFCLLASVGAACVRARRR